MVRKFKNGNITIRSPYHMSKNSVNYELYAKNIDNLYDREIIMKDLYFNQINGYMYLVDYNTQRVYDFSECCNNILYHLDNLFRTTKKIKLYPLSKKESKSLLEDRKREENKDLSNQEFKSYAW